jgi:glycine dehydrogenase subunit 1
LCYHKAHYAAGLLGKLPGYAVEMSGPFFKEFVLRCPRPAADINRRLLQEFHIVGGYALAEDYPSLSQHLLLCVTEMNTREEIDRLAEALGRM